MTEFIQSQPDNKNFLSPLGFRFALQRAPNVTFNCQQATLPTINLGAIKQATPFVSLPWAGDKLNYDALNLRFMIDEDMKNYLEIFNWMISLGHPDNFEQYKTLTKVNQPILQGSAFSDGTLLIQNAQRNWNISVSFTSLFPISLSPLEFNTTQTDVQYLQADVQFQYKTFTIAVI